MTPRNCPRCWIDVRPTVLDSTATPVCVRVLGTRVSFAETDEPIEIDFCRPKEPYIRLGPDLPKGRGTQHEFRVISNKMSAKVDTIKTAGVRRRCGPLANYCDHLLLTDRAVRSAGGFMKLLETAVLGLHLIDRDVDRATAAVDHHVPRT